MVYSVWRPELGRYDYYETPPSVGDTQTPIPHIFKRREIGVTPEEASWKLPASAKRTGSGMAAKGVVATIGMNLPLGDFSGGTVLQLAGVGFFLYWFFK